MVNQLKFHRYLFLAFICVALTSCSIFIKIRKSPELDEQTDKNTILVVGYFDDSQSPFNIGWGDLKQIRPASDEPYKELRANDDGLFYLENLPVGSYKLISIEGREKGALSTQPWIVRLPEPSEDRAFRRTELRAKKPGVYFLGSYKLELMKKGGLFSDDKFETTALKKPTEKQVLKKLLKQAKGTKWEEIIKKRIRKLK